MHKCLLVSELVHTIAEACTRPHDSEEREEGEREDLRTLNALARTCRAFLNPALDVMWHRQDTLAHLVKCLPEDLWELTNDGEARELVRWSLRGLFVSSPQSLTRCQRLTHARTLSADSDDWSRFDFYARRVRILDVCTLDSEGPPHRSQAMLKELREMKDAPLLPHLRTATITLHRDIVLSYDPIDLIAQTAPQTLTEVGLAIVERGADNLDQAREFAYNLPALVEAFPAVLRVSLTVPPGVDFARIARSVARWRKLRSFALSVEGTCCAGPANIMDYRLLQELSAHPTLLDLKLAINWPGFYEAQVPGREALSGEPITLGTVRSLCLSYRDTVTARQIFEVMSLPALQELEVTTTELSLVTDLPPMLESRVSVCTLRKLSIIAAPYFISHAASHVRNGRVVSASFLRPLKHLHRLEELFLKVGVIHSSCTMETCDADWDDLAPSWPRLRILVVEDSHGAGISNGPSVTFPSVRTLVHLARHCPELRSITMTLRGKGRKESDARTLATSDSATLPVHLRLTHLHLRHSIFGVGHYKYVPQILARVFPRLIVVTKRRALGVRTDEEWKELMELVQRYRRTTGRGR